MEFIKYQNRSGTSSQALFLCDNHSAKFTNSSDSGFPSFRIKLSGKWDEREDSIFLIDYNDQKKTYLKRTAYGIKFLVSIEEMSDWEGILISLKQVFELDETFIELNSDKSISLEKREIISRRLITYLLPKAFQGRARDIYVERPKD